MTDRMLIIIIPARTISKEVLIELLVETDIPTRLQSWGLIAKRRRLVVVCDFVLFIIIKYLGTKIPFAVSIVKHFFNPEYFLLVFN